MDPGHGIELWALLARVCNYNERKASTEGDNFIELENKAVIWPLWASNDIDPKKGITVLDGVNVPDY